METKDSILIVDDDPKLRKTLSDTLKAKGYTPITAATGKEALDRVTEEGPVLALIDLKLEDMSGLEVLREIKECSPGTECIVITGYASKESAIEAVNLGAYGYLQKPYNMDQLLLTIRRAIEKRETEKTLRESEQQYRGLFDSVPIGLYRTMPDGQILDANPALQEMLGYPDKEALSKLNTAETYINGEDRRRWQAIMKCDGVASFEVQMRRRDGTVIWVRDNARVVSDPDHQVLYYDGSLENITDQKRASEKIIWQSKVLEGINKVFREALTCESEKEIASTCLSVAEELTHSKFGFICEKNPEGRLDTIAISNPGWDACKMPDSEATVLTKDMEIRGIRGMVIRKERPIIFNEPTSHPEWIKPPEGHPTITCFLGVPLKHANKTIGMIGLANKESGYDLSDQKAIEALSVAFVEALMRKRAEMALNRERERFRVLVEESPLGVSMIGESGDYNYVNPKFVEIFGYTLKDIPNGREWFRRAHPDPEYRTQVISTWINELKAAKQGESRPYTFTVTCKDGSEKVIRVIAVPMKTGGQFVIYEDLTEQKKLEAQFRQSQKMEAIGTLSGGIAHDFNNILGSILGYTELSLLEVPEDSKLKQKLMEVFKAGKRAETLIQQILAFSRKQELEQKPLQLKYIVKESLKLLRSTLPTDIEIKEDIAKDLGVVNADPTQMQQVIMNLCTNAGHAMQKEGGVLTIGLANVELDDTAAAQYLDMDPSPYLRFSVSDTGYGMTPDVKERIFEPFFTTKALGEGTGLGLSVVHGIVKSHGGTITVYSEPGKGSTFHIYLPLIQEEAIRPEVDEQAPILTGNERILFIDDEPTLVEIGTQMLERLGYKVTTKISSIEALELFKAQPDQFDLVITDMTMPKMTGDKLAKEFMKIRSDIPIIMCTGHSGRISEEKAIGMGIKAFAMKPLVMRHLANTVRKVLDEEKEKPVGGLILVIDDDDQFRGMLRQTLEGAGYDVMDAPNGKEGIRVFRENPADLVITDIIMPEKEGIETIKELRREFTDVKIIAISGGGRIGPDSYLKIAKGLGAQRTLTKPIERYELLKTVMKLINE